MDVHKENPGQGEKNASRQLDPENLVNQSSELRAKIR